MTLQEMLVQIPRLSQRDQLVLLEALSRSLQETLLEPVLDQRPAREAAVSVSLVY
jgi:hypothetical protein